MIALDLVKPLLSLHDLNIHLTGWPREVSQVKMVKILHYEE